MRFKNKHNWSINETIHSSVIDKEENDNAVFLKAKRKKKEKERKKKERGKKN